MTQIVSATTFHAGKQLSGDDIYPATDRCYVCGFTGERPAKARIQRDPEIQLLHCPRCEGLSASFMPLPATLDAYYSAYYKPGERAEGAEVAFYRPERMARHIFSKIVTQKSEEYRILDFGGGDGTIALLLAQHIAASGHQNIRIQVVDYGKRQNRKEGAISLEFVDSLSDTVPDCDCVIASAVFEHIPELGPVLLQTLGRVRPGGFLYARTPYVLPLLPLGIDMTYPGHVHDLGHRFWNGLSSWLDVPMTCTHTAPSIVETGFSQNFVRTLAAYALKFPARLSRNPLWTFYGGWEVVLRRNS